MQQGGNEISATVRWILAELVRVRSPEECNSVCWHSAELALVYAVLHLEECGSANKSKSIKYKCIVCKSRKRVRTKCHRGKFRQYDIYDNRYLMQRHHLIQFISPFTLTSHLHLKTCSALFLSSAAQPAPPSGKRLPSPSGHNLSPFLSSPSLPGVMPLPPVSARTTSLLGSSMF